MNTNYQQIANLGITYINGLQISYGTATTLTVASGQVRDITNTFDIVIPNALTLNAAINGVNGLDSGTFAANTFYYVFAIFDVTNVNMPAILMSNSISTPTMPSGYSNFVRIGCWSTGGSAAFNIMYQSGSDKGRHYQYDTAPSVLSTGTGSATFASISLANVVPGRDNVQVSMNYTLTPGAGRAGDSLVIRPSGSSVTAAASLQAFTGAVASQATSGTFVATSKLVASVPRIDYMVTNATDGVTLGVVGFTDPL